MTEDPWERRAREFDQRPIRSTIANIGGAWVIVVVVIVLGALVAGGVWLTSVLTSDLKGQGDAEKIKNSAPNRIQAQEKFEDLYAEIRAADVNIGLADERAAAAPADNKLATELAGLRQYCNTLVGRYNAEARKFRSEQFRAIDLPAKIDDTDRLTDCRADPR